MARLCVAYLALRAGGIHGGFSPEPEEDAAWQRRRGAAKVLALTPPLGAHWAELAARRAKAAGRPGDARGWLAEVARALGEAGHPRFGGLLGPWRLRAAGAGRDLPAEPLGESPGAGARREGVGGAELRAVARSVRGRLLFAEEVQASLAREQGLALPLPTVEQALWRLVRSGRCGAWPGVRLLGPGTACCTRCGSRQGICVDDCASCGDVLCPSCAQCASLGLCRGCRVLFGFPAPGRRPPQPGAPLRLPVGLRLTAAQRQAAGELAGHVRSLLSGRGPRPAGQAQVLVWAACGAGKTEVACAALQEAWSLGRRALVAAPRRDVVRELGPRLAHVFPGARLAVLSGGMVRGDAAGADVVVATTHQALRFYRAFPLVILDEGDAFPLRGDPMLRHGLERACAPGGLVVHLTATPEEELLAAARRGRVPLVTLPARPHGYPLPVPEPLLGNAGPVSPAVVSRLRASLEEGHGVLVFAPTVARAELAGRALREALAPFPVEWAHARDPGRDDKRERLRQGGPRVLVATTILERGVNLPGVDVAVLWADDERVFDARALVQMAGRAGRSPVRPTGRVWFCARRCTPAMTLAGERIRAFNEAAAARGLLRAPSGEQAPARPGPAVPPAARGRRASLPAPAGRAILEPGDGRGGSGCPRS